MGVRLLMSHSMACGTFGDGINDVLLDHCFCMYILSVFWQLQLGSSCSWQSRWLDWGWRGWREEETEQLESWEQKTWLVINMFQDWGIEQQQQLVLASASHMCQGSGSARFQKGMVGMLSKGKHVNMHGKRDGANSIYRSAQHNWLCPFYHSNPHARPRLPVLPFSKSDATWTLVHVKRHTGC